MGDVTRVVVATGTKREAAALAGAGWTVIAGGGDAAALDARLTPACEGASGVLSFGMAGALAPGLAVGDWVIGEHVTGAVSAVCDPAWRDVLTARLPSARIGGVHADGRMVVKVAHKQMLGASGDVCAVDMESHVAARVAAACGLPLAIVRCVSDEANRALPPAIAVAMRPGGGIDGGAVLRSLVAEPRQIPSLIRVTRDFARAMRALRQGGAAIEGAIPPSR